MSNSAMRALKDLRYFYKKYKTYPYYRSHFQFIKHYENSMVDEHKVLFQSYDGTSISGNPFYILRELCSNDRYSHLKKYVVASHASYESIVAYLEKCNLSTVEVVKIHTDEYCELLATCKYLVNNATFAPYFIKRPGQVYLNTWHGTPLKHLGRRIVDSPNEIANTQRNFLMSDYLLAPNELTLECFRDDYMLKNFYQGKYVVGGYPRNEAFFDDSSRSRVRRELDADEKNVVVYMPTWRGNLGKKQNGHQFAYVVYTLYELDGMLDENTIVYVKFHSQAGLSVDYEDFKQIREFPDEYETYEFLNAADCLVTDYSSVMFDFANTGRKIVLYAYDSERYFKERGSYIDFEDLPFLVVRTVSQLASAISPNSEHANYSNFMKDLIERDSFSASANLCSLVFGEATQCAESEVIEGASFHNGNPNLLIFAGSLARNGITTALRALISCADFKDCNILLTFDSAAVEPNKTVVNDFFGTDYLPFRGRILHSIGEAAAEALYFKYGLRLSIFEKSIERVYRRELARNYPGIQFDLAVHYSGYEKRSLNMIHAFDGRQVVYVHNDMAKEGQSKGNFSKSTLLRAYRDFESIVCVRESSKAEVLAFQPKTDPKKVFVAHNFIDVKRILNNAKKPLIFDSNTQCNVSDAKLRQILNDPTSKVILNIGRFSPEKGQSRLIDAFLKASNKLPDAYLVIIGGYGVLYEEIEKKVSECGCDRIIICQNIANPYPIFDCADVFFLSSFYEGLPVTIFESFVLGVPVISTNIPGPDKLLGEDYGALIPNSEEGMAQGMDMVADLSRIPHSRFDVEAFNIRAQNELLDAWGLESL